MGILLPSVVLVQTFPFVDSVVDSVVVECGGGNGIVIIVVDENNKLAVPLLGR